MSARMSRRSAVPKIWFSRRQRFSADPVTDYAGAQACDREAYATWCRGLLARGVYAPASQFEVLAGHVRRIFVERNVLRQEGNATIFGLGGDLMHRDILDAAMKGIDGVFHFAALWLLHCHDYPRSAFEDTPEDRQAFADLRTGADRWLKWPIDRDEQDGVVT